LAINREEHWRISVTEKKKEIEKSKGRTRVKEAKEERERERPHLENQAKSYNLPSIRG